MSDGPRRNPAGQSDLAARNARRAAALRENLRRRKEQARARQQPPPETGATDGAAPSRDERALEPRPPVA